MAASHKPRKDYDCQRDRGYERPTECQIPTAGRAGGKDAIAAETGYRVAENVPIDQLANAALRTACNRHGENPPGDASGMPIKLGT